MLVLYGSQTGTAAGVADKLARDAKRRHVPVRLCSMADYPLTELVDESMAVLVVATTGQGEEPDSMKRLWRSMLRRNLPGNVLSELTFAVFGLGDSSYPKFNFVAKKLYKRLQQLGATPLVPLALADDQHQLGVDGALDPFCDLLWPVVLQRHPMPPGVEPIPVDQLLPAPYRIVPAAAFLPRVQDLPTSLSDKGPYNFSDANPLPALLTVNTRLAAPDHFQDIRHIELQLPTLNNGHRPGDVAYLMPRNTPAAVATLLDWLQLKPETSFSLEPQDAGVMLPPSLQTPEGTCRPTTLRELLTSCLDICGVPRRKFFEMLAFFTALDHEREKLREFDTAEGQEDLYSYANRPRRTAIEVLHDFPGTRGNIPLEYLFDLFPPLRPRAFSIASAACVFPNQLHLTVAIVNYKTWLSEPRRGVCTSWIAGLDPVAHGPLPVSLWIHPGSFRFPDLATPVIMVGPGTGVAPFRAFIQERVAQGCHNNVLIFGNRNLEGDFLYRTEWQRMAAAGQISLVTAFSRDQENKIYVQHRMREPDIAQLLWVKIHTQGAYVFLAGNAKRMPVDVREAFEWVAQSQGGLSATAATAYIAQLEKEGRYQQETWS